MSTRLCEPAPALRLLGQRACARAQEWSGPIVDRARRTIRSSVPCSSSTLLCPLDMPVENASRSLESQVDESGAPHRVRESAQGAPVQRRRREVNGPRADGDGSADASRGTSICKRSGVTLIAVTRVAPSAAMRVELTASFARIPTVVGAAAPLEGSRSDAPPPIATFGHRPHFAAGRASQVNKIARHDDGADPGIRTLRAPGGFHGWPARKQ